MKIANAAVVLSILVDGSMVTPSDALSFGSLHPSSAFFSSPKPKHDDVRTLPPLGGGNRRRGIVANAASAASSSSPATSDDDDDDENGAKSSKSTIASASFNLIKGAVGSGVLSLPAGVAAYGDVRRALVPTTSILLVLGSISAYTFHLLGRLTAVATAESSRVGDDGGSADSVEVTSIGQLWDREVGKSTSWLVSLVVMITCYGTCLAYSITLGDTLRSLAETAGLSGPLSTRRFSVAAISLLGVYPMCCLRSLAALAPVSVIGVIGILATCAVMTVRALPGGAYSASAAAATGTAANYLRSLPPGLRPSFGVTGLRGPSSLLVVSSMAATAFLVHMSSPDFYRTLKDPTPARFAKLSAVGFAVTVAISALMMCLGFLTFGGASKGMILNNYSTLDAGATLCRLLMGVSLLGSYGFLSNALKNAYYQIFHPGVAEVSDEVHYRTSRWLVGSVTALALLTNDAGFVVSINGAVLGSALIYVIPSFLFLRSTKRRLGNGTLESTTALRIERWWNKGLIGLGAFLALAGAWMSVVNSFFPHLL